jgi:hypothetical protein
VLRYFPIEGRLVLSDDTTSPAHVIFDTDDEMLCVHPNDFRVGSQVVPARTASSSGVDGDQIVVDVEQDYYLGTIEIPGAKVVRGMVRTTWASNPEPADNLWRQASGTHLDILDGVSMTSKPQSDLGGYNRVATLGGYTFYVNDLNHLVMKERIVIRCRDRGSPPQAFNRARQQCTVSFRLLVGFFLQSDFAVRPAIISGRRGARSFVNDTVHTLNVPAPYPYAGRRLIAVVHGYRSGSNGPIPTSVRIGGVSATMRASFAGTNNTSVSFWEVALDAGATVEVRVAFSNSSSSCNVELFSLGNVSSLDPVSAVTEQANGGALANVAMNVSDSQVGLVASSIWTSPLANTTCTWVNATDQADGPEYTINSSAAVVPRGSGSVDVQANWSASGNKTILGCVFG